MQRKIAIPFACLLIPIASAWAGALTLETSNPDANPEAKALKAVVVARVTACHEPAKSTVTARSVEMVNGDLHHTPLKVVPLKDPGTYAVLGPIAPGSAIDLAVTNPEYRNYEPRMFLRAAAAGVQWSSVKRFFGTPPTEADLRAMLAPID